MSSQPRFTLMSGAGNTFALIDARKISWASNRKGFVSDLCKNAKVDGVLFLEEGREGADLSWDFFNADGSSAEMCGNAARCAGLYCDEHIERRGFWTFSTQSGRVEVQNEGSNILIVEMTPIRWRQENCQLQLHDGTLVQGSWVDTGVPHFVSSQITTAKNLLGICREIRHHPLFPAGINVTLIHSEGQDRIKAVTYERGVEDFTAACGTGAVAAATVFLHGKPGIVQVNMPGGVLHVNTQGERPLLKGPAVNTGLFDVPQEMMK